MFLFFRVYFVCMRFQVPQNLDVPDTIFLGLNFKQLLYLGGAGGFLIFLYLFAGGIVPVLLVGGPIAGLAIFLSFATYNNQSSVVILQSLVRFFTQKKMYMWRKSDSDAVVEHTIRNSDDDAVQPSEDTSRSHRGPEKVKEMSTNLVFADEEGDPRSDPHVDI